MYLLLGKTQPIIFMLADHHSFEHHTLMVIITCRIGLIDTMKYSFVSVYLYCREDAMQDHNKLEAILVGMTFPQQ